MAETAPVPAADSIPGMLPRKPWQLTLIEWLVVVMIVAVLVALLVPQVQQSGSPGEGRRWRCKDNLKKIGLALHKFHDVHGTFPPAYVVDESGRPAHSWRVLLLPYFEEPELQALYDAYQFDEPWNGPRNRELAARAAGVFRCPAEDVSTDSKDPGDPALTSYVAIVGPDTAWPGDSGRSLSEFKDGTSKTLFVVEIADSGIHWMEPRDLHVSQMAPTINSKRGQGISSRHKAGAQIIFADGAARFLIESMPAEAIRGLLTIHGGEAIPEGI